MGVRLGAAEAAAAVRRAAELSAAIMAPGGEVLSLFVHFLMLSLLAIGGAITVVPDMHRVLVEQLGLLTDAQFNASIAIAQGSPGPNVLFVAVMGYQAAGLVGALATLAGIMLPSTTLALAAARWGHARRDWRPVQAFKAGMAPIVVALMFATAWILSAGTPGWVHAPLSLAAALLVWRTRVHLLLLVAAGALLGATGLV
jgi:chromate transporter